MFDVIYEMLNFVYVVDFIGDVNIIEGIVEVNGESVLLIWVEG